MNKCPVCLKKFDELTTSHFFIVEDRIIPFCSESCKNDFQPGKKFYSAAVKHFSATAAIGTVRNIKTHYQLYSLGLIFLFVLFNLFNSLNLFESTTKDVYLHTFSTFSPCDKIEISLEKKPEKLDEPKSGLVYYYDKSVSILEEVLTEKIETDLQLQILELLLLKNNSQALQKLEEVMKKGNELIRRRAAVILARHGSKKALRFLRRGLNSNRSSISSLSVFALGRLGDRKSQPHLKQLIGYRPTRFHAATSALYIDFPPAKRYLLDLTKTSSRYGDRIRAASVLALSGEKQVKELLLEALEKQVFEFAAAQGLAALGEKKAVPVLVKALRHDSLRIKAAKQLVKLGVTRSYKIVLDDLDSKFKSSRLSAAAAVFILVSEEVRKNKEYLNSDFSHG
ncbi:MAG: HEAT repeat domain-containing protein [Myxococcota bacterium]